jgi:transcriptional regulator with PAS, ATPase and Fis domain
MEKSAIFRDERNKLFLDIMNSIRDALWVLDKHGNVLWVNNAAKRGLFEVSDIDLVNQNVLEMEKRGLFYPSIARLVTESKHFINTVQVTQNNQKLLVSGDFIPDENGDIEYIVSHARTLSETLNTNMELEKAEELLQRYKSQIRQLVWEKKQGQRGRVLHRKKQSVCSQSRMAGKSRRCRHNRPDYRGNRGRKKRIRGEDPPAQ